MWLERLESRAHIGWMLNYSLPPPAVQITENKSGTWDVTVSWSSGQSKQLGNFLTEQEARIWGQSHILQWLDSRKTSGND
jgi:hypothetical protein